MRASPGSVLVGLTALALAVTALDVVGWAAWGQSARRLAIKPEEGAEQLAARAVLVLPAAVERSRRLAAEQLGGATRGAVTAALERLGRLQRRWFVTDPEGAKNLSRAALLRDEVEVGLDWLEHALALDPTSPYLHRLTALVLQFDGRLEEAIGHLVEAEGIAPGYARPAVELPPEDVQRVRLEGLERHVELYPRQRVNGLLALAAELRRLGENERAGEVLAPVAGHPMVEVARARWELDEGALAEAARRLETVATRASIPKRLRGSAWALLAEARDRGGDAEGALVAAREALKLNPSSPGPYLALAAIAERRGDLEAALAHLRTAWGIAPTDLGVLLSLARVAERLGREADAALALERAAETASDRPNVAVRLVDFYLRHGDYMEAALRLSRFLDRFPTDPALLRQAEELHRHATR